MCTCLTICLWNINEIKNRILEKGIKVLKLTYNIVT